MRELPIVFPISLAIIVLLLLFTSAYAISSSAYDSEQAYAASLSSGGLVEGGGAPERSLFQKTAFAVCPLH